MRRYLSDKRSVVAAIGVAVMVAACDPVYTVGARQYLEPMVRYPDSATTVKKRSESPSFVAGTVHCIEETIRSDTSISDVRPWHEKTGVEDGMNFGVTDSAFGSVTHYGNIEVRAFKKERPTVEVNFTWFGVSGTVPMDEQRRMVRVATKLLGELRAACLPTAIEPPQCVAEGFGGHKACLDGS
jgi:hypothetical protein